MNVKEILSEVSSGNLSIREAEKLLKMNSVREIEGIAKIDTGRISRRGIPEIILAEGKLPKHVAKIAIGMLRDSEKVLISRMESKHEEAVRRAVPKGTRVRKNDLARMLVLSKAGSRKSHRDHKLGKGGVAIITAGTADIPIAEEAKVVLEETDCRVITSYDVGVAGIHRLFRSMRSIVEEDVDVIIAVAGREGAMPSIIAGLVDVPVIGVPTSFGYGYGEKGVAALMSMLQACSLGITTVNIDSGVAAGVVAALIVKRSRH